MRPEELVMLSAGLFLAGFILGYWVSDGIGEIDPTSDKPPEGYYDHISERGCEDDEEGEERSQGAS